MTTPTEPATTARSDAPLDVPRVLAGAFKVLAPTAVITALLYYFGWARTDAAALAAGVDQSLFGYSTSDYVLRSVSPLLKPLGFGLLAAVVITLVAGAARSAARVRAADGRLTAGAVQRGVWLLLAAAGAALTAGALLLPDVRYGSPAHSAPLLLLVGAGALWAATSLAGLEPEPAAGTGGPDAGPTSERRPSRVCEVLRDQRPWLFGAVAALVLVALFATVLRLAFDDGEESIARYTRTLPYRPTVTITSPRPLDIDLPGVSATLLDPSPDLQVGPRFRYSGLHLLVEANGRLFLVTSDFGRAGQPGPVAVVPHTDDLRLDFQPPGP